MNFRMKYLVYPVRSELTIRIEPVFPVAVIEGWKYELEIRPFSGLRRYGLRYTSEMPDERDAEFFAAKHPLRIEDGVLKLDARFPQEDCYILYLHVNGEMVQRMEIYALEPDLFTRQPYKGDNHMHTWMSDGKDSPMYMAAAACRRGYDYCVITDHHKYEPSIIAKEFFGATQADFLVIPGEEIHSPGNPVHIISLGGRESVNDWLRASEDEYRAAVEKEIEAMDAPMLPDAKFAAAASQTVFDRIHAAGGVSVLCHPHWIIRNGYNEAEDVTEYLMDNRRFDALELIAGGAYEDGTQLQISYYKDREKMPILGSSDAHGLFGDALEPGNFTIVFASGLDVEPVKESIKAGYTVAGNANKLYGEYRLVKYAYFLMRSFYAEHDRQRNQLGARMLRLASSRLGPESDIAKSLAEPRPSEMFAALRWSE